MAMHSLADLVDMWRSLGPECTVHPPATEAQVKDAESALRMRLPAGLREFYGLANGAFLENGWEVLPLRGTKSTGRDPFTGQLREFFSGGLVDDRLAAFDDDLAGHPNLLVFANDGCGGKFAFWLPSDGSDSAKIVMIGDYELRLSDLAARTMTEWCTAAILVNLDLQMQLQTASADVLRRLGIVDQTDDERRAAIERLLQTTAFGACDCYAEGRSFERTQSLVE